MDTATIKIVAALIHDQTGRVLLVRKRGTRAFMQPGGKRDASEDDITALCREIAEELGCGVIPASVRPLGEVNADVVRSATGWFEPNAVKAMFEEGTAVAGATVAAARMAEAHSKWGRKHYAEVPNLEWIVALTQEVVDGLEGSGIPLFVGWRDADRCESAPGRAAQLMQILREWRGGLHLVATTAAGLSPLEAILTNEGPGQAKLFGWSEPFPDCAGIKAKHDEAEEMTDELCTSGLLKAIAPDRFSEFERGVGALRAATP